MATRNYYRGEKIRCILQWSTPLNSLPDKATLDMYEEILVYALEEEREVGKYLKLPKPKSIWE